MCSEEVMVMENLRNIIWGRQCDWVSLVFFFGGSGEGYTLVYLLGVDGGVEIGLTIWMPVGN